MAMMATRNFLLLDGFGKNYLAFGFVKMEGIVTQLSQFSLSQASA